MHISHTIKGKLKIQQKTNTSLLVSTIKAIIKTPIKKLENPIFFEENKLGSSQE